MSAPSPGRSLFPPDPVDAIRAGRREGIRHVLDATAWARLVNDLASAALPLVALWGEANGQVHALFHPGRARPLIATTTVEAGRYLALSGPAPAAVPFERMMRDLYGFEAMHARDLRPLLDSGSWTASAPLRDRPGPPPRGPEASEWREVGEDEDVALLEAGPVGVAGGPLRVRLAVAGTRIARAEWAHGHAHRGLLASLAGAEIAEGAAIAERVSGGASVAHALAFARAVEQASGTDIAPEAAFVRELALEAERAASFLAALAEIAAAADAARLAAGCATHLGAWREAMAAAFGHRFARGIVRPGGVGGAIDPARAAILAEAAARLQAGLGAIGRMHERMVVPRLLGRAPVATAEAARMGASGIVGRASGQGFDARRAAGGGGGSVEEGLCAATRSRLRLRAIGEAAARISALAASPPAGAASAGCVPLGRERGEGVGLAEAPEGEAWHFVRLDGEGRIAAAFVRDPGVAHAAISEAALAGEALADATILRLGFGLSPEGFDL